MTLVASYRLKDVTSEGGPTRVEGDCNGLPGGAKLDAEPTSCPGSGVFYKSLSRCPHCFCFFLSVYRTLVVLPVV